MPHAPGDTVVVIALKRHGQIVERQGERYRVVVGGLTMTCREHELRVDVPTAAARRAARRSPRPTAAQESPPTTASRIRSSIDLHGMTVVQARDALVAHVDAALRNGEELVEVVHGIGTGRVRAVVVEVLRQIPSVRRVQPHPTNRGVTLVHL